MYDFGNSAYALIVMTLFFPLFFTEYVVPGKFSTALWGLSVAISILIVAVLSPILGAFADQQSNRKGLFIFSSIIAIIGTIILPITAYVPQYCGIATFILVNSAFAMSLFLYDSFISVVPSKKKRTTYLSSLGWAIGYVGGPFCLFIAYIAMGMKLPADLHDYQILFLVTGAFFFICSLLPYYYLPKDKDKHISNALNVLGSFRTAWKTLCSWRSMKHIFVFLFAMYFIMDGLTTVVYFFSLFAKINLGFSIEQIVLLMLIVHAVGIFTTAIMGWLAEKFGEIRFLLICSAIWVTIIFLLFFFSDYNSFMYIAALTGIVIGSTPAIARGFFGKIIPEVQRAELFGFHSFASRIAALIGPLVFGIASSFWNMKVALFTVVPFFIIGAILLVYVNIYFNKWQNDYRKFNSTKTTE